MSKADETILENLKKIKEYCEQNACTGCIYNDKDNRCIIGNVPQNWELDKVKEEQQDIDVQEIKEFEIDKNNYIQTDLGAFKTRKMDIAFLNKLNEIIKAVKQLNKKINKE